MSNNEIWMERTHGRKSKCKTEFKAVINKVLVSGLVLATVLGSTTPAFAATLNADSNALKVNMNETKITQEYGISVEAAIKNIKNTIAIVNQMKASGSVSEATLQKLADQLYALDNAVYASGSGATSEVKAIITQAEKAIDGVSNAKNVQIALTVVKMDLGFDNVTVEQAKATVKSFKDVPSSHWAYKPIMNMVNKGIIAGTTTPVNGVGTFSPDTPMTRAQFITVVTRYLYPNDLKTVKVAPGSAWYAGNYDVAVDKGLIYEHEFSSDGAIMNQSMTRQEMAMVLVRAMDALGEDTTDKISKNRIPDYNQVGTHYRDYVRVAYKEGLIAGTDKAGTFNPTGTLTRAQAATVLNRLIDPSSRTPVSDVVVDTGDNGGSTVVAPVTGTSWYEGSKHGIPKAGDTVIKSNGEKVVLKYTKVGMDNILGYGQGVDFVTGTTINGNTKTEDRLGIAWQGYGNQGAWVKDPQSGEVHLENEWMSIMSNNLPNYNGKKDGETAGLRDGKLQGAYYQWDGLRGTWYWIGPGNE